LRSFWIILRHRCISSFMTNCVAILNGRLLPRHCPPPDQLPNRSAFHHCHPKLRSFAEGYLDTVVGSGTYVCVQLPDDLMQPISSSLSQSTQLTALWYGATLAQTPFTLQPEPALLSDDRRSQNFRSNSGAIAVASLCTESSYDYVIFKAICARTLSLPLSRGAMPARTNCDHQWDTARLT